VNSDEQQIANLIYSVNHYRDQGRFDEAADLFAHATFQTHYPAGYPGVGIDKSQYASRGPGSHGVQQGADEVRDILKELTCVYEDGLPHSHYVVSNLMIDIDDDAHTAESWSYYTVFQSRPDFPLQPISAGRYHDRFEKVDGKWRFTSRDIHADHSGDLSHHMYLDPIEYGRRFNEAKS
jgi:hypothetical protein